MSKKLVLLFTVMVLLLSPISAYADDSIPIMKSLVFQLNQHKIAADIFKDDADIVVDGLKIFMDNGSNKDKLDEAFAMLKASRDKIKDVKTYANINKGILELERAYKIAQYDKKYPSSKNVKEYFKAIENANTIFFNQAIISQDLYFQVYNNIMAF